MLQELEILGLRGFATRQRINFAVPNGRSGSGLTVLLGPNNAGKSTVVEAIRALAQRDPPSLTQGRRNLLSGDKVELKIVDTKGNSRTLSSLRAGSSQTQFHDSDPSTMQREIQSILVLPSRRSFNPYFGQSSIQREYYTSSVSGFPPVRTSSLDQFNGRLFEAEKQREEFDRVLGKVLDPIPNWTIDQLDTGQFYLKVIAGDATHSSEGLGEGLVSLFFIIDALYDSKPEDIIVIDEPELSLHPSLQQKLSELLAEYSSNRQIIIATHSPYFVSIKFLQNQATIARIHLVDSQSQISQLSRKTATGMIGLLRNYNNPHILGIKAQEVFFLEDPIILVEGQEDVIFYEFVQEQLSERLRGNFYGWGVGGADNMEKITDILQDLGYAKVVGILDGNKVEVANDLTRKYPRYHFFAIPAEDVRTKSAQSREAVIGLLDDSKKIRPEFLEETRRLFRSASNYLEVSKDE